MTYQNVYLSDDLRYTLNIGCVIGMKTNGGEECVM